MPAEYTPRNKAMHSREVRYERNDRFLGKRDWGRVGVFDNRGGGGGGGSGGGGSGGGVPPGLNSSSNGGSYDPPSKRRPSGRHGFGVDNGCRDLPRMPESQQNHSMFNGGYFGAHKNDRYGAGGMNHYGRRNGITDEYFSRNEEALAPVNASHHSFASYYDGPPPESHRGSRYGGWDRTDREHRERHSGSPEVFDRKVGVSRYGGFGFQGVEARQDRYASRETSSVGDLKSRDAQEEQGSFETGFQQQRGHWTQLHEQEPVASPRKKTRLGWGEGLASYEQKHTSRIRYNEDEHELKQNPLQQLHESRPLKEQHEKKQDSHYDMVLKNMQDQQLQQQQQQLALSSPRLSDKEASPVRERTPVADVATEIVVGSVSPVASPDSVSHTDAEKQVENEPQVEEHVADVSQYIEIEKQVVSAPQQSEAEKQVADVSQLVDVSANGPQELDAETHLEKGSQRDENLFDDAEKESSIQNQDSVSNVKVQKEGVLLMIEQVEIEIDSIEKELARLDVEMEADAARTVEAERKQVEASILETETAKVKEEVFPVIEDIRMIDADECNQSGDSSSLALNEDLAHLLPEDMRCWNVKLYSSPQEAPAWLKNLEFHQVNKNKLLERLSKIKEAVSFKEKLLVLKHRVLKMHADELESSSVLKKVLSEPVCQHREAFKMPPMILWPQQRTSLDLVTENRLVDDPVPAEQERKTINPWTAEERKIFLEKFAVFHKNFSKIASFLRNKSTGDCVEFYYRNQKSEDFAKLRRKQQLKKRHSRASYLATTTYNNSRLRDSNVGAMQKLASAATYAGSTVGRVSRNNMKVVSRERLSLASDCAISDAGGRKAVNSGNISTGVCSLSSDAPLTPSRLSCERAFSRDDQSTKQKGVRSSRGRREHAGDEADSDWTDAERELFLDALLLFGKDFRSVALHVRSKNEGQCKTFFSKARKRLKLERILEQRQASALMSRKPVNEVAVVNRACDDLGVPEVKCGHNRLANGTDRSFESEDMDVSIVVDSGPKEAPDPDSEAAGPESNMEGTSAAPATLADSPVSSVITSPGLVSSSSPAVQVNGLQKVANDFTSKPLTECVSNESKLGDLQRMQTIELGSGSQKFVKDEPESAQSGLTDLVGKRNGVTGHVWLGQQEKLSFTQRHAAPGLLSVPNPGVQLQNNAFQKPQLPVLSSEQQQTVLLQQLMSRQMDDHALQQSLAFKQQQLLALLQAPISQDNHFTNNQKLLAFQAFLQEHKLHEPQHLFNFLAQQPQQGVMNGLDSTGFQSGYKKVVPGLASGDGNGPFLTGESLHSHERRIVAKPAEEVQVKSSDIKLFGQSLLSQPVPPAKALSDPSASLTSDFALAPQFIQGSYGSVPVPVPAMNGSVTFRSGSLPDCVKSEVLDWQIHARAVNGTNTCTREALNLWRGEMMKSSSLAAAGGVATSGFCQQQKQLQPKQPPQQQQQQMFPAHLMQFPNGNGWKTAVVSNGGNVQQARVLAQLSLAEQQHQQQHQHQQQQQQQPHHSGKA